MSQSGYNSLFGFWFGGTGKLSAFNLVVTGAGQATLSGSGSPILECYYTSSGKVTASGLGESTLVAIYSEGASGTVVSSSSGVQQFQYTESVSGGGVCSGTAPPTSTCDYVLTVGGSVTASGSNVTAVDYPNLGTAAVVVSSGSDSFLPEYDYLASAPTGVLTGSAGQADSYLYTGSGSSLCSGAAIVVLSVVEVATGTITLSGAGIEVVVYIAATAGVLAASGVAATYELGYVFTSMGGGICQGSVSEVVSPTYVIPAATGSVLTASGAADPWQSFPDVTGSGTVTASGSSPCVVGQPIFILPSSGWVVLSGSATLVLEYDEPVQGVLVSVTVTSWVVEYDFLSSSSVSLLGSASVQLLTIYAAAASVTSSGAAVTRLTVTESASGVAVLSGTSSHLPVFAVVSSGVLIAGSSAGFGLEVGYSGSGIVVLSGAAYTQSAGEVVWVGSGGLLASGFAVVLTGGAGRLSGDAGISIDYPLPAGGRVSTSGQSPYPCDYVLLPSTQPGLLVGAAGVGFDICWTTTSVQLAVAGATAVSWQLRPYVGGFCTHTGTAAYQCNFLPLSSGQVLFIDSSLSELEYLFDGIGLLLLSGSAGMQQLGFVLHIEPYLPSNNLWQERSDTTQRQLTVATRRDPFQEK